MDATFEGDFSIRFHLAAPLLARPDPNTGHVAKRTFGPGVRRIFSLLARLKRLRGTRWDIFGQTEERRAERALIVQYEQDMEELIGHLAFDRMDMAECIASLPERIRGYGHVKLASIEKAARAR